MNEQVIMHVEDDEQEDKRQMCVTRCECIMKMMISKRAYRERERQRDENKREKFCVGKIYVT